MRLPLSRLLLRVLTDIIQITKTLNFTKTWIGTSFFENLDAKDLISLTDERSHTCNVILIKPFKIKETSNKVCNSANYPSLVH